MTITIRLSGCNRYSYKGELFERGLQYELDDKKASMLLGLEDDYGRQFFTRIERQAAPDSEIVVEREESEERPGVRITRKIGRPRRNPSVVSAGDTSPLKDVDDEDREAAADRDAGVEV